MTSRKHAQGEKAKPSIQVRRKDSHTSPTLPRQPDSSSFLNRPRQVDTRSLTPKAITQLQRVLGNHYVQRLVRRKARRPYREADDSLEVAADRAIERTVPRAPAALGEKVQRVFDTEDEVREACQHAGLDELWTIYGVIWRRNRNPRDPNLELVRRSIRAHTTEAELGDDELLQELDRTADPQFQADGWPRQHLESRLRERGITPGAVSEMTAPSLPAIPDLDAQVGSYAAGTTSSIRDLARWVLINTSDSVGTDPAFWPALGRTHGANFDPLEPPWWSTRRSTAPREYASASETGRRALMLLRDYKEWLYWEQRIFRPGGTYYRFMDSRTDQNIALLQREAGFFLFINDHLGDEATELESIAQR